MTNPKIGLELEFYKKGVTDAVKDVFDKSNEKNLLKIYNDFIDKWVKKYAELLEKPEDLEILEEDHKGHTIQYCKFSVELYPVEGDEFKYWIKPTLDNGCVEVIAEPLTYQQYRYGYQTISLNYLLFGIMEELGFSTEDYEGPWAAGHINVDYKTGFDKITNVLSLFRYINNTNTRKGTSLIPGKLKKLRDTYVDPLNSMYIGDLLGDDLSEDVKKKFTTICEIYGERIEKIIEEIDEASDWQKELKFLMEEVKAIYLSWNKETSTTHDNPNTRRKELLNSFFVEDETKITNYIMSNGNRLQSCPVSADDWWNYIDQHYMALNSESFNGESEESWRVEFRAVPMPSDYDKLLEQMRLVVEIVEASNKEL